MSNDLSEKMKDLRQKAEFIINEKKEIKENISNQDLSNIIHDLSVYQIELELQNEELRDTQKELEQTRNNYIDLFNQAPNGYITLSDIGQIIQINSTFADMIGVEASTIIRKSFTDYIVEEDKPEFLGRFKAFFKNPEGKSIEIGLNRVHAEPIFVSITGRIIIQESSNNIENNPRLLLSILDITERKKTEEALRENQSKLEIAMNSAKMAWWEMDISTGNVVFDKRKTDMLGYTPENFKHYKDFTDLVHPDDYNGMMNSMQSHLDGLSEKYEIEYRIKTKSGKYQWFYDIGSIVIWDSNGSPLKVTGFVLDISERKKTEDALKESEERFKKLSAFTFEGIIIHNNGYAIDVNQSIVKLLGYERDEIIGMNLFDIIHQDYHAIVKENIVKQFATAYQIVVIRKDGTTFDAEIEAENIFYDDEYFRVACIRDITERKQKDEELKNSEEKFRSYVDFAPHGIFIADQKGNYLEANNAASIITGYKKNELISMNFGELTPQHSIEDAILNFRNVVSEGFASSELPFIRKDGSEGFWSVDAVKLSENRFIGFVTDITARKHAEEALRESEEKFLIAFKTSPYAITLTLPKDGRFIEVNDAFFAMTGYTLKDTAENTSIGMDIWAKIDDRNRVVKEIQSGINVVGREFEFKKKNGEIIFGLFSAQLLSTKKDTYILSSIKDITDRKKAEALLSESEEKFRKIFENSGDGLFFLSFTTEIVYLNDSFAKMHGYTIEEMKNMKLEELDVDDLSQVLPERFERINKGEKLQFEVRHYHKDGHIIELEVTTCLITLENEKLIVAFHRDITERKQAEEEMKLLLEQLRESNELIETNLYQKNSLLEELSESEARLKETVATKDKFFSIIAHDLRSPFSGLLGLTNLMTEDTEEFTVKEIRTMSEAINKSANSLFKLIEDLFTWSRTQTDKMPFIREKLDLYEISLNTTFSLNQTAKNKNIKLIQNINQGTFLTGDRNMLTTVFRNLVSNSIKFTRENGIIEIGIEENINELNEYYVLYVKDNGIGMSKENQSNLFKIEKQISTKGTNDESGTGLGLILCKEFIQKHGGKIWVESEEGIGSTFYFSLKNQNEL